MLRHRARARAILRFDSIMCAKDLAQQTFICYGLCWQHKSPCANSLKGRPLAVTCPRIESVKLGQLDVVQADALTRERAPIFDAAHAEGGGISAENAVASGDDRRKLHQLEKFSDQVYGERGLVSLLAQREMNVAAPIGAAPRVSPLAEGAADGRARLASAHPLCESRKISTFVSFVAESRPPSFRTNSCSSRLSSFDQS